MIGNITILQVYLIVSVVIFSASIGFNTSLIRLYSNVLLHKVRNEAGELKESFDQYEQNIRFAKDYALFFFITTELLWFAVIGLMILDKAQMPESVGRVLDTGIHIPILFLLFGNVIRYIGRMLLAKWNVPDAEIKKSILVVVVFLDTILLFTGWETALFLLAILCGKYIWLDSSFDFKNTIKFFYSILYDAFHREIRSNASDLAVLFGRQMIYTVLYALASLIFCFLLVSLQY